MGWLVYIIKSEKDGDFYKGITEDMQRRLEQHNTGQSSFTSTKMPWTLVYLKEMSCKREAIIEEKRLKKLNRASLERLTDLYEENLSRSRP